jgi:high frequency lysogenization protein
MPARMLNTIPNQTIALAGLAQAVHLAQQLAQRGQADEDDLGVALASVLKIDADSVADIYAGAGGVRTGLRRLLSQLGGDRGFDPEQARYAAALMTLEARFMANPDMVATVRSGVKEAARLAETRGSVLDGEVVARLSGVYQATLSTLQPRVMVSGEPVWLNRTEVTDRIRALLLAGVRALVLWRQCGGARWKLLFTRPAILRCAGELLKQG